MPPAYPITGGAAGPASRGTLELRICFLVPPPTRCAGAIAWTGWDAIGTVEGDGCRDTGDGCRDTGDGCRGAGDGCRGAGAGDAFRVGAYFAIISCRSRWICASALNWVSVFPAGALFQSENRSE